MNEQWLPVAGYEGLYEVSDQGRVRNARTGRILKSKTFAHGYYQVCLSKNGIQNSFKISKLVMTAFDGPADGRHVDHINTIRSDDRLINLEYVTQGENILRGRNTKITEVQIEEIFTLRAEGWTCQAIADKIGCSRSHIGRILNNETRTIRLQGNNPHHIQQQAQDS